MKFQIHIYIGFRRNNQNSNIVYVQGACQSNIISNYSNCSGLVSGILNGDLINLNCSGIFFGSITNFDYNQTIPISGAVYGTLDNSSKKYSYSNTHEQEQVSIKVATIEGTFTNINQLITTAEHVLDIKSVNTLGRKALSEPNPILGSDLNKTSKNLDKNEQYAIEEWQLIEYAVDYEEPESTQQEIPETSVQTQSTNTRTTLATPKFLRSMNTALNTRSINVLNEPEIEPEVTYRYCAYLDDKLLQIYITQYDNTQIIDPIHLIIRTIFILR